MALLPVSISIGVIASVWFRIKVLVTWLVAWAASLFILSPNHGQFAGAAVFFGYPG